MAASCEEHIIPSSPLRTCVESQRALALQEKEGGSQILLYVIVRGSYISMVIFPGSCMTDNPGSCMTC